ncbi:MAG: murein biosynthesis integral membrane protein MurJ [Actinomycetaceae bacterium]|nr:murein biosynthesis integral membrane protein MurJ [Actinomycetaceae bacterium]
MSESSGHSVARNSLIMGLGTLVSRILGLVRSPIMLGAIVGMTSLAANSFDVANKLPTIIYMIVAGGLVNAVLVPAIVRATEESTDDGQAFINKLITLSIVLLGAITLVLTIASPLVVKAFAATMHHDWFRLTVAFTYWCMPQVFFYGMYTVLGQILNARENFGPYTWAPVLNNVVAIAGFLVILAIFGAYTEQVGTDVTVWTAGRIAMLGGFSTLGIVAQALILIIPMRRLGLRYRPDFSWKGAGLGRAGKTSWWMFLTMLVSIVPTMMWSNVAAGATTRAKEAGMQLAQVAGNYAHTTAYTIYTIPQSLIVVSIATAVFTRLSQYAVNRNLEAMRKDVSSTARTVSTLTFLSTVGLIVLAGPISRLLAFTVSAEEAVTVARVLIAMSLGIVGVGMQTVFNRVYYAFEDTRGNFFVILPFQIALVVGYWFCHYLPPQWSVVAVGLVQSIVNIAMPVAMGLHLRGRMEGIDGKRLLISHGKLLAVSLISLAISAGILRLFGPFAEPISVGSALIRCLVIAPVIVATFLGAMRLFRMEELSMMMSPLRSLARKFGIGKSG